MPEAAHQPTRETPVQAVRPAAANDPQIPAPQPTGLDRESARWLPLVVPGFALVVLLVCGALVWAAAL